jgi:hypothetical protein
MNIFFQTAAPKEVEGEIHFTDGTVYNFEVSCQPSTQSNHQNLHVVVGRTNEHVDKLLVKIDDYWYTEPVNCHASAITIKINGREKYTQMLRDAAMKVKPSVDER